MAQIPGGGGDQRGRHDQEEEKSREKGLGCPVCAVWGAHP